MRKPLTSLIIARLIRGAAELPPEKARKVLALVCGDGAAAGERDPAKVALAKKHYESRKPTIAKFQAAFDRHLDYAKHETLRKIEKHFRSIKTAPIKSADLGGGVAADLVFDQDVFSDGLLAALRNESADALQVGGNQLFEELGRDDVWSMPEPAALKFLDQRTQQLADMPAEIAAEIRDEIQAELTEGQSIAQMSKNLYEKFADISRTRGATIADTETGAAFGTSRHDAMKSVGIKSKTWLTSHLPNVRAAHALAEEDPRNQRCPVDQPFHVGGEELMYPCDETGSPGNVINCHCIELADSDEEEAA